MQDARWLAHLQTVAKNQIAERGAVMTIRSVLEFFERHPAPDAIPEERVARRHKRGLLRDLRQRKIAMRAAQALRMGIEVEATGELAKHAAATRPDILAVRVDLGTHYHETYPISMS